MLRCPMSQQPKQTSECHERSRGHADEEATRIACGIAGVDRPTLPSRRACVYWAASRDNTDPSNMTCVKDCKCLHAAHLSPVGLIVTDVTAAITVARTEKFDRF